MSNNGPTQTTAIANIKTSDTLPHWLPICNNKQTGVKLTIQMYYRSGTGGCCCICAGQTLRVTYQMAALFCVKLPHGCHLERATSNQKSDSVNRCVFTWRTFLPNFIQIPSEMSQPRAFCEIMSWLPCWKYDFLRGHPKRRTRRVAIWDQFLIQNRYRKAANCSWCMHRLQCLSALGGGPTEWR